MNDAPALEMIAITKRFGNFAALDDASLNVRRGTVHALLGENGAGKTTLMRIAYGLVRPDRGVLRVDGKEMSLDGPDAAIDAGIGMVHQHPENVAAMTATENLELGRRGRYVPGNARAAAAELAARVGFAIEPDARVGDMSVAAQQRLEILKAIGRDARLLVLDEPTAVLAPTEARELLEWLRHFADSGGTAIIITHKLHEARTYADDLTVLRRGRTVLAHAAQEVTESELATAMLGLAPTVARRAVSRPSPGQVVARAVAATILDDRRRIAVRDASFDVSGGEVVGIAGVENSGHHELLLCLAGRLSVSRGAVALPDRIGFVPEDRHRDGIVLDFTLTENVAIHGAGSRHGRIGWRHVATRTAGLLREFDVSARGPRERISALSGGNQQKVVLARELETSPDLIVLENPTRGLDIRAAAFVFDQIRQRRDAGAAIVMYSSDIDEVIAISDRVLVVHAGVVRSMAPDRAAVGAAMLGVK